MKLEQYRRFDLIVLSVLALGAEGLGMWLHNKLPGAGYYLSFSSLVAIIALMRWGIHGIVVNSLLAILTTLLSETISVPMFLYYFVSNSAVLIVPKIFGFIETSKIVSRSYWLLGYIVTFYGVITLSRGLLGGLINITFTESVMLTISQILFCMIMSYLVLILLKNREGLLVDMKSYFINEQKEIKE